MGSPGFFSFNFFILFTEAGMENASINPVINRGIVSETVAKTASVNIFCPPC